MILHLRPLPNRVAGDLEEPDTPVSIILRGSRGRTVNESCGAVERITVNSLAESFFSLAASYFFVGMRACR